MQADSNLVRIVSPYLFASEFTDSSGNVTYDGAAEALELLDRHPDMVFEIVTNSVLTSDNFPAQSVIDMNMAPRLLLPEDMQVAWRGLPTKEESNGELVNSDEWERLVNHPRLRIYETGRLDSAYFGGEVDYGKLHGKFVVVEHGGFVGTTNFDYRSQLCVLRSQPVLLSGT